MLLVVILFIAIIIALIYLLRFKPATIRFGIPLAVIVAGIISFFIFQNIIFPYEDHVPLRASEQSQEAKDKARQSRMQTRERQGARSNTTQEYNGSSESSDIGISAQ